MIMINLCRPWIIINSRLMQHMNTVIVWKKWKIPVLDRQNLINRLLRWVGNLRAARVFDVLFLFFLLKMCDCSSISNIRKYIKLSCLNHQYKIKWFRCKKMSKVRSRGPTIGHNYKSHRALQWEISNPKCLKICFANTEFEMPQCFIHELNNKLFWICYNYDSKYVF